jgi:hypothetical protein
MGMRGNRLRDLRKNGAEIRSPYHSTEAFAGRTTVSERGVASRYEGVLERTRTSAQCVSSLRT